MQAPSTAPQTLPPQAIVLQMCMGGWIANAVSAVIRLNVPDHLRNGPMTAEALVASGVTVHTIALQRVLRACASVGVFTEDPSGRFGLTPLSEVLTADAPGSVKILAQEMGGTWGRSFCELPEAIRTGEPQVHRIYGMGWWDYLKANPKEMATFGEAMKSNSQNSLRAVLELYDFSGIRKVVDVGGGFGHLVVALLEKYPHLQGTLLDIPDLIPVAKQSFPVTDPRIASRFEYVGGDMFSFVPSGDAYVLKHIIHDWDDEHSLKLLENCHRSMEGAGHLICVDSVLPSFGDTSAPAAKFLDLLMMVSIRGQERTRDQWESLYQAAGFRVTKVIPLLDNFGTSIIEGVKQ